MSRHSAAGGSRYPSAYGHTPSYRSYVKGMDIYSPIDHGTSISSIGSGALGGIPTRYTSDALAPSYTTTSSYPMALGTGGPGNYSSAQSRVTQSSYSSTSRDGARPVVEYSTDNQYRASATGPSGIPHSSYAHTSSAYSSDEPWKNRVASYSYNI